MIWKICNILLASDMSDLMVCGDIFPTSDLGDIMIRNIFPTSDVSDLMICDMFPTGDSSDLEGLPHIPN